MTALEICLLIMGLVCVACSFIFSEHLLFGDKGSDSGNSVSVANVTEEIVKREVEVQLANLIDEKIEDMEVRVEKITAEKIMALGEYSQDIQKNINQNHDEVMFLYNMLNDKEVTLKNTIRDIEAIKTSVKKMAIVNDVATDVVKGSTAKIVPNRQTVLRQEMQPVAVSQSVDEKQKTEERTILSENKPVQENKAVQVAVGEEVASKIQSGTSDGKTVKQENAPTLRKAVRVREASNNNQMILNLYAQGKSNIDIAKELGLGIGEVRLVIDLFNSR